VKIHFIAALLAAAAALAPETGRYRAEWLLADANARLAAALRGHATSASVEVALDEARRAMSALPADPRPPFAASTALLMLKRSAEAKAVLERALAAGERPELTLNLGRARGTLGDEQGAQAAFLRTAWASPAAIATLPSSMRTTLREQVRALEQDLRAGRLAQAPPLG
jgi:tetratricopeptide (TPR) repeat protein